jgi:hypothetical protein
MLRRLFVGSLLLWPALIAAAHAAEPLPPPARWIPRETIAAVEVFQPKAILDLAFDGRLTRLVSSLPAYQAALRQEGAQGLLKLVDFLETRFNSDRKTLLTKLLGGGITFAVGARGETLLMVDAQDDEVLRQIAEIVTNLAKDEAAKRGQPARLESLQYQGITVWKSGEKEAHAIVGARLLISNRLDAIKAALDLRSQPDGQSLAAAPAYQEARKAVGADAQAMAFVSLAAIKNAPRVEKALSGITSPVPVLAVAGMAEALRQSNWLALAFRIAGDQLGIEVRMDGRSPKDSLVSAFSQPPRSQDGVFPNLAVPRRIAAVSLYRDVYKFYAAKDQLFPERTSGLIFFENMMGIFFSGRSLTDEVLSQLYPEIRMVVARQEYGAAAGPPAVQIPSFAAVMRLRHPQEFGEVLEEAFQKAVGLVTVSSGQRGVSGMIIDRVTYRDIRYTVAYFTAPAAAARDRRDARYNYRPTLAKLGDFMVLSSTEVLARDLIDALRREAAAPVVPVAGVHSLVELDTVQLIALADANRKLLVRQNMAKNGTSEAEAEANYGLFTTVIKQLGQATLKIGAHAGQAEAGLQFKLNLQ